MNERAINLSPYLPCMKHIWTILLLLAISVIANCQTNYYLVIGTYTRGNSEGIYVYKMNTETGDVSYVSKATASNPSYLDISPDEKFVYAVNEDANDKGS